jgi:hypothetical protein
VELSDTSSRVNALRSCHKRHSQAPAISLTNVMNIF